MKNFLVSGALATLLASVELAMAATFFTARDQSGLIGVVSASKAATGTRLSHVRFAGIGNRNQARHIIRGENE